MKRNLKFSNLLKMIGFQRENLKLKAIKHDSKMFGFRFNVLNVFIVIISFFLNYLTK